MFFHNTGFDILHFYFVVQKITKEIVIFIVATSDYLQQYVGSSHVGAH